MITLTQMSLAFTKLPSLFSSMPHACQAAAWPGSTSTAASKYCIWVGLVRYGMVSPANIVKIQEREQEDVDKRGYVSSCMSKFTSRLEMETPFELERCCLACSPRLPSSATSTHSDPLNEVSALRVASWLDQRYERCKQAQSRHLRSSNHTALLFIMTSVRLRCLDVYALQCS